MRKHKRGFTLIEVSIFLAVTALLFLSVTIGVQNSIYQQRYTDAVQSFADFLGNLYSETTNVQSAGNGRSDYAIYGKLAVFASDTNEQAIYVYNVVGEASVNKNDDTRGLLQAAKLGVLIDGGEEGEVSTVGITDKYVPRWGSRVQTTDADSQKDFSGMILVARDPATGTVRTYINTEMDSISEGDAGDASKVDGLLRNGLGGFQLKQVDFCVNPNGNEFSNSRMDVRLANDARNASGVSIMPLDGEDNSCNGGGGV